MTSSIELMHEEIVRSLSTDLRDNERSELYVGTHNAEYGNADKATKYRSIYQEFLNTHHLLAWQEVDQEFLNLVALSLPRYTHYCTPANSRGQAVGFTVHERLEVLQCIVYSQVQAIKEVRDLRPVLRLDLVDRMTDLKLSATVVHYKSNYGGSRIAGPIRRMQAQAHVDAMQIQDEFVISLGDYNQVLGESPDAEPLYDAGFQLVPTYDQASTHASGGRLDGMFAKNIPSTVKISSYRSRKFWRNTKIGCAFSDHALVSWKISVLS